MNMNLYLLQKENVKNKKEYLDWKKKKQEEQKLNDDIPF